MATTIILRRRGPLSRLLLFRGLVSSSSTPLPLPLPPSYQENWRNPSSSSSSLVPSSFPSSPSSANILANSRTLDADSLMNTFADWMASQRWSDLKQTFQVWIRALDPHHGKPNRPDLPLYNHYLRANLMLGSTPADLLDLVAAMDSYNISPDAASFNLVLKAMCQSNEIQAAQNLLDRMILLSKCDDESYNLVVTLLFSSSDIDAALKYLRLMIDAGHTVSMDVFMDAVRNCMTAGRLDTITSIIAACKATDHNKALCPSWNLSNFILNVALQADHAKLAFYGLEFLARWIKISEISRQANPLSADEGLLISALNVAARTYDSNLLDASWAVLHRSLRQKRAPNPHSYISRIHAYAALGNLHRAFTTLNDFETAYADADAPQAQELFSPFTSLHSLVAACCKNGFSTLDSVYFQLENLSKADPPYKSVAALNCVILGSANIWDLERAYETFESIEKTFGLTPNIHSYNALISAFGKHKKTGEASKVFDHLTSLGVTPNAMTYSLLVDAHLVNRDQKTALSVIDNMVEAGHVPSKDTLTKVRRRCLRESDFDSNDQVQSFVRKLNYRMYGEGRREQLFNLQYATDYP